MTTKKRVTLLHGAGYAGGELVRILANHPELELTAITSRSFAGKPVWHVHPSLRHATELQFIAPDEVDLSDCDALLIAAEHGKSVSKLQPLIEAGFDRPIVDLSADFRLDDAALYNTWYGYTHPAPHLLERFVYGLPEVFAPYPPSISMVANPGCFATGLCLSLWPLSQHVNEGTFVVTACTGASGSGSTPKPTTHFPTRDGNVRAYKILRHQHTPEVYQTIGQEHQVAFTPVSGPWTRGIWGTAHVQTGTHVREEDVTQWFTEAYGGKPLVRLWPGELPELRYAAGTPYCDIGWVMHGDHLVVGFALDNLLKGAASQAIQNMNLLLHLPESLGLLPTDMTRASQSVATR